MKIAVFYTEGSNCINVDLYGNESVTVKLFANKTLQNSVFVSSNLFNNEKAHVTFNSLLYKYDKYTVVASTNNGESISKEPELISAPTSKYETNYIEDTLTSKTTDLIKDMVAKPIFEQKGNYLVVNLEDSRLITIGNALVSYSGGGNRYLNTNDGLLVLQKEPCIDINDSNSPNVLKTVFKSENECTNLLTKILSTPIGKAQVQKGIYADVFTSFEGKLDVDFDFVNFDGSYYCFSALMSAQENADCSLFYVDENEQEHPITLSQDNELDDNEEPLKVNISNQYEMVSFNFNLEGNFKLRLKLDIFNKEYNKLFLLLPQLEINPYPTSRILLGKTRQKDLLSILPYSTTNMDDGGFVEIEAVFSRKITQKEGCVIIEWVDENGNGLRILQDEDNSIIACINDGDDMDSVTSAYIEITEGDKLKVKVSYDKDLIHLNVNDNEYCTERVNYKGFPNTRNEVKIGHSENIPSFGGDILNIKFGK